MHDELTSRLAALPEPDPPAGFAAQVTARIARAAEERAPVPVEQGSERGSWAWTLAGVAAVLATWIYGSLVTGTMPGLTSPRLGNWLSASLGVIDLAPVMALGLLLYLAGLLRLMHRSHRLGR